MMDASPTVSVVVPARDAAPVLPRALASVLPQLGPEDEVVIAVAPSADETAQVAATAAAHDSRVRVVDNPAGTTPAGLNRAIAASRGEVLVRLDAQAVLPDGYVSMAVETLRRTGAGNVGGRQVPIAESGFAAAVAAAMRSPLGSGGAAYRSAGAPRDVETVYLGVFQRRALEAVGGFDETLLRNQDYELNHRLRSAGWRVRFEPAMEVAYSPRSSVRALARQYRDYGRYKRRVMTMHPDSIRARQLAPLAMVGAVLGSAAVGAATGRWRPAAVTAGSYAACVVAGGVAADPRRASAVGLALATMHWSWAIGFLQGPPRD